jgi:hypothetical protein
MLETSQSRETAQAEVKTSTMSDDERATLGAAEPFETTPTSLENATRLVEPMRLNNLTPEEIGSRHLRRATRELRRARGGLFTLQRAAQRLLHSARAEAQRGQRLARTAPGQRRAHQVQVALRKAAELNALFAALEDECSRYGRRVAAARDLLTAWEGDKRGLTQQRGRGAAKGLSGMLSKISRVQRFTRERLDEVQRALVHVSVAEEAMRRDTDLIRLDPVNFARFAGRGRVGVRIAVVGVLLMLVALIYPPWGPPHLALACTVPAEGSRACATVHATSGLRLINEGNGVLVGWATVSVDVAGTTNSSVIPIVLAPRGSRVLSCSEYSGCAASSGSSVRVQLTTSGGSLAVAVVP